MKRTISMLPIKSSGANCTHIKVVLYYTKGGINYFTCKVEARGIYLSVTPVEVSNGKGYTSESYTAFSGIKQILHETARYNAKFFDAYVPDQECVDKLVNHVLCKNGLELEPQV